MVHKFNQAQVRDRSTHLRVVLHANVLRLPEPLGRHSQEPLHSCHLSALSGRYLELRFRERNRGEVGLDHLPAAKASRPVNRERMFDVSDTDLQTGFRLHPTCPNSLEMGVLSRSVRYAVSITDA